MTSQGLTPGVFDPAAMDYSEISFSEEEYLARQAKLRALMERDGIDVMFVTTPDLVCWLHGFRAGWYKANGPMRYPQCYGTVLRAGEDRIIHFDNPTEEPVLAVTSVCRDNRYFGSREAAPNIAFIMDELAAEGWLDGRVGMEFWSYVPNRAISEMFEAAFRERGCEVVDASAIGREARRVKSPAEIAYIIEAVRLAEVGHQAVRDCAREGITELALFGEAIRAMMAEGGELSALIPIFNVCPVVDGRMISLGHSLPGRRTVARDTVLCADLCGVVHRYHGNTLRGHYFGEPPAAMVERYERAAGVFDVIAGELRAGMTVGEVNRRLKRYYDSVGLSVDEGWALGYELGLSLPPDWVGDFYFHMADEKYLDRVFEPGMVTNFESLFDTALIETMVWEADGVRLLGSTPPALSVVPL